MDITARYISNSAPYPLVASATSGIIESERNRLQQPIPFEVLISIDGSIDKPRIDLGLDLARDLRLLVRERLVAGDSDAEAIAYLVDRYGEYVLLRPTASGSNLILWIAGPVMFLLALAGAGMYLRRRRATADEPPRALSEAETARLREILGK